MIDKDKVHKLADFLRVVDGDEFEEAITEWLEQNQSEPVVVGLSDKQVRDLACVVSSVDYDDFHTTRYDVLIQNWLKTQTFESDEELRKYVAGLRNEIIELNQKFKPDWDDAPIRADEFSIALIWYKDGVPIESKELSSEQRPKPTPEAGQVWQYKGGSKYHIDSLGRMKFEPHTGWVDCVTFRKLEGRDAGQFFTRTMDDFMAKFVRVSDDS